MKAMCLHLFSLTFHFIDVSMGAAIASPAAAGRSMALASAARDENAACAMKRESFARWGKTAARRDGERLY
ncbi:hypothetical protein [Bifidobacterium italicum]|uniref:hypothetical protein n=1 Tax=Bifidobacterium italicum TaxID=1960968 RepID=UPI0010551C57|nr:hypothetical protein [Bifidobacterium italicum]